MEAAADVVAHAAERHRAQRARAPCRAARRSSARLARARAAGTAARTAAETSARRRSRRAADRTTSRNCVDGPRRAPSAPGTPSSPRRSARARAAASVSDVGRLRAPCRARSRQTRAISLRISTKPGRPQRDCRRKVRAAVERLQVGRQPDAHRPAARSGRRLHERHVDAIDVGPLLAIDLDRDEVLVQHRRDVGVLERLVLHHVAPVAGRVADREKDRLVLGARPRERLVAPRIPVDRIVRVLEQIRDCARARVDSQNDYDTVESRR